MTREDFVALCKEMLELGATEVSAGIFKASFRPPQPLVPRRDPRHDGPDSKPPTQQSPEDARHGYYNRVMGTGR